MAFVKKLFGEAEVEAVLQRLDRLTQDEAHTTVAQTLEIVYGLVQNTRDIASKINKSQCESHPLTSITD